MTDLIPAARPVPSTEDRMRDARTDQATPTTDAQINLTEQRLTPADRAAMHPGRSFRSWMSDTDRDQLDARAACAEAERDEALDARDVLRVQLDTARRQLGAATDALATIRDAGERIDRALAVYDTTPGETCSPPCTLPKGHPEECDANAQPSGLGSPAGRAQDKPAAAPLLRQAAAGRREYAKFIPEKAEPLDLQAHTLEAAARVVEGDLSPLYDWLPSWQWTDEMNARLHPAAAALNERTPRP